MSDERTCDRCNYERHLCPGCGTPVPHGTVACKDCDGRGGAVMTDEYTPSTDDVRDVYVRHECYYTDASAREEDVSAEFDRFIAQVKAEAWEEGAATEHYRTSKAPAVNPYREKETP